MVFQDRSPLAPVEGKEPQVPQNRAGRIFRQRMGVSYPNAETSPDGSALAQGEDDFTPVRAKSEPASNPLHRTLPLSPDYNRSAVRCILQGLRR